MEVCAQGSGAWGVLLEGWRGLPGAVDERAGVEREI